MITRTKEEIETKVKQLWSCVENIDIRIYVDKVYIELSNMYQPPGLSFAQLKALSEFFDTEKIDDTDRFSQEGCETCDFGSSYGFTLKIG